MLIQCTKALLDKMDIKGEELKPLDGCEYFSDGFTAWHANFVNINRRKAVVLMNDATRFSVVIYRPKSKDFQRMKDLMKEAIIVAMRMEGISEDIINRYMADAGEFEFSKTANRSMVAKLNNTVREVGYMQEYLNENELIQKYVSLLTGRFLQKASDDTYFYPNEKMIENLDVYCDIDHHGKKQDVLDVNLYQLKIKIAIEGFDIGRRVLVPSTYSLRSLHNIIQMVFDWHNYHLHAFEAKKEGSKGKRIVMDNAPETMEWQDFDNFDILQERFVSIEDIFREYDEVLYEYDFGDYWEHVITFEKVIKSNELKAIYLDGKGERPPEDVGGPLGYKEYLRIMADENDPEYWSMKIWSQKQKERKRSSEEINKLLRSSMVMDRYSELRSRTKPEF